MSTACTISVVGYLILLLMQGSNRARYFATFCITSGTYTTIGLCIAWCASSVYAQLISDMLRLYGCAVSHNLGSETKKAAGIPIFMAIGQCGSILGSHIFPKTEGPAYTCVHPPMPCHGFSNMDFPSRSRFSNYFSIFTGKGLEVGHLFEALLSFHAIDML